MTKRDAEIVATLAETAALIPPFLVTVQWASGDSASFERIGIVGGLGLFCMVAMQLHANPPFRDWLVKRLCNREEPHEAAHGPEQ